MAKVTQVAEDKEGMTLRELILFVQQCARLDVPDDTRLRVENGFRQQVKKLETR